MRKPILGEKLFLVSSDECIFCEVTKIGRKYFIIWAEYKERQFEIETWRENTECYRDNILYESRQIYLDEQEKKKYIYAFEEKFRYLSKKELTLKQLQDAAKILGITLKGE